MGTLWTSDFESYAAGDSVTGWVNIAGTFKAISTNPVGGSRAFGPSPATANAIALNTSIAAQTDMGMKTSQKIVNAFDDLLMCHMLRSSADGLNAYTVQPYLMMGSLWLGAARRGGGTWTQVGSFTQNVLTLNAGDILHVRSKLTGQGLDIYAWVNGNSQPDTPQASFNMGGYVTAAGYGGLYHPQSNATPINMSVDNVFIYDNVTPATSLAFTSPPTSGNANAASSTFTVTANGGISPSVTLTPSDGGAGGTFSPANPVITAGQTTTTFTYTPTTGGNRTITITNDGGLTNPTGVTYNSVAATTLQFTSAPTSGGISSASSNFVVGVVSGGIVGTVTITPNDGGVGGTFNPTTVNISSGSPTASFTYTPTTSGARTISITNNSSLTNPAGVTYTATGATAVTVTGPSSGSVGVASTAFTVGANGGITGTVRVTPNDNSGGGTFTPTFVDINNATPTATFTYTPNSAGAKTLSFTNNGSLSNPANKTYTGTVATAISFSVSPSAGYVSVASSNFTVTVNDVLLSTVRVTFSDSGGGGSFTPAYVDLSSGTTSASATYTPATAGTKTITTTNNGSLSNPSASYTANTPPLTVDLNDTKLVWSKSNWDTLTPGTFGVGLLSKQTKCTGAYVRFKFTGATGLSITFDEAGLSPTDMKLKLVLNGSVTYFNVTSSTATVSLGGTLSSGTTYEAFLQVIGSSPGSSTGRWNGSGSSPTSVCRINAITLNSGSLLQASAKADWMAFDGDSISEAIAAQSDVIMYANEKVLAYSVFAAEALGVEYGCHGMGGQGWGLAGNGGVPNYPTAWKYHTTGRLRDFTGCKALCINMGTNDSGTVQIGSFLADVRATLGAGVWILIILPFGGYKRSDLIYEVNSFVANTGDAYVKVVDISSRLPASAFLSGYLTTDGIHPNMIGHSLAGSMLADEIRKIVYPQTGSGGSSVPTFSNRFNRSLR